MVRFGLVGLAWLVGASGAAASEKLLYQPPAAWVRSVEIPRSSKPSGAAVDVLLWSIQERLASEEDQTFQEIVTRINSPQGLQAAANLTEMWNPKTEDLIIHRVTVTRDGKTINLLAAGKTFTVLRRETNLEAAVIDGELTATLPPEDLRVGDVVDFALTLIRREPALGGHSEGGALVAHAGTVGRLAVSASWDANGRYRTWTTSDLPKPVVVTREGRTEWALDQTEAVSPEPPNGAFSYDRLFGVIEMADFKDWREVSATSFPLYDKAAIISPGSALHAEVDRIKAATSDPKARVLAALRLVENQVRYLYVALDAGGLTPAAADVTWTRRFGDCKGKTVLLIAMLKELGVDAQPALVNTILGDGLDRELPLMHAFDHVIVRLPIGDRVYWLDGTRMGDENLDVIPIPDYHWALPVTREGADLERLTPKAPDAPLGETALTVDARAGLDKPSIAHETLVLRGDAALFTNLAFKQASKEDADRALRQMFTHKQSWVTPTKLGFTYDAQKMEFRATMEGGGMLPFTPAGGGDRDWLLDASYVGFDADFTRRSDFHRDAPYAVAFPAYSRAFVQVDLPDAGKGFLLGNEGGVNRTIAGVAYTRAAAITGGRATMIATSRALRDSFPASEATADEAALRSVADYPVSIRYTKQDAAVSSPPPRVASGDPESDAAAAFQDKAYPAAEEGFSRAIAAHPTAKLYYDRAAARAAQGKTAPAQSDLHEALRLDPKDTYALVALARIKLAAGAKDEARTLFASALAASADPYATEGQIALAYEGGDLLAEAAAHWEAAAAVSPSPDAEARLLNAGCWARARINADLRRAREDCDASLAQRPGASDTLDSRAFVELKMNDLDKALADYSAALETRPRSASSLFGRSVVEQRLKKAGASADRAAALQVDPNIAKTFAKMGVLDPH